jgi:hypothetical protein
MALGYGDLGYGGFSSGLGTVGFGSSFGSSAFSFGSYASQSDGGFWDGLGDFLGGGDSGAAAQGAADAADNLIAEGIESGINSVFDALGVSRSDEQDSGSTDTAEGDSQTDAKSGSGSIAGKVLAGAGVLAVVLLAVEVFTSG